MRLICFARYALVACIVALLAMGIFSRRGWLDWQRMVRNNDQMLAKLEQTKLEKAHWETRLGGLKSNRRAQERTVRQYLGFVKKDEIVIEF
jgi:cell division protein FtsB